jgi:hypothetical protein
MNQLPSEVVYLILRQIDTLPLLGLLTVNKLWLDLVFAAVLSISERDRNFYPRLGNGATLTRFPNLQALYVGNYKQIDDATLSGLLTD